LVLAGAFGLEFSQGCDDEGVEPFNLGLAAHAAMASVDALAPLEASEPELRLLEAQVASAHDAVVAATAAGLGWVKLHGVAGLLAFGHVRIGKVGWGGHGIVYWLGVEIVSSAG
jgi:hypothetical protein